MTNMDTETPKVFYRSYIVSKMLKLSLLSLMDSNFRQKTQLQERPLNGMRFKI